MPSSPPQEQTLDNYYVPPEHPLHDLITATNEAVLPRKLDTTEDAHEAFRYEWGTWCSNEKLETVMSALDNIRIYTSAYEGLLNGSIETTLVGEDDDSNSDGEGQSDTGKELGKRIRVAGGKYWDIILHVMPKGARYQWKWTEGSWIVVQPLTGQTEVAQLRGPDRDGYYKKMQSRDLRGGSDGGNAFGATNNADKNDEETYSSSGEACVKYLGGPLRSYSGKAMQSTALEVVIRPPITTLEEDIKATGTIEQLDWEVVERILTRVDLHASEESEEESEHAPMDCRSRSSSRTQTRTSSRPFCNRCASAPKKLWRIWFMIDARVKPSWSTHCQTCFKVTLMEWPFKTFRSHKQTLRGRNRRLTHRFCHYCSTIVHIGLIISVTRGSKFDKRNCQT